MISDLQQDTGSVVATRAQGRSAQRAVARLEARLAARKAMSFTIPLEDTDEFQGLGTKECARVRRMLGVFRELHEEWADLRDGFACHGRKLAVAGIIGWSPSRIRNTYYEFTKAGKKTGCTVLFEAGDWRMLARWQRQAHTGLSGRPAFLRLWQWLCDNHQRSAVGAFHDLASLYTCGFTRAGKPVKGVVWGETFPGYESWPLAVPHTGLPEGWTKNNLTKHTPDRIERTAARVGMKKASGEGLKARFSRVGLKPFQLLSADDLTVDVKCLAPGEREPVRPRCLGLHDYATDALVNVVMKTTRWDADAKKLRVLNQKDALWFVLAHLTNTGYRADTGTVIRVELGTMAIPGDTCNPERPIEHPDRTDARALIWHATACKVTFENSGGFAKAAHGGQSAPPVGGNPRFKAIEGAWNRLHNRLDGLPGQTGKDHEHCPEHSGREAAEAVQLLKKMGLLPSGQAEQLKLTHLTFQELAGQLHRAVADLNAEPEHEIGEWEKCGFIVKEYFDQAQGQWFPLAELEQRVVGMTPQQALVLAESLKANAGFIRARRLTRAEALATGTAGLVKLPHSALLGIVGRGNAMNGGELKAVSAGEFVFHAKDIDTDDIAFFARDAAGQPLREGARYLCVVNPMSPDVCAIYDAQERFVSVCPRHWPAAITDPSAVRAEVGEPLRFRNAKLTRMRADHTEDAAQVAFIREHNAALTGQAKAGSGQRAAGSAAEPIEAAVDCREELLARAAENSPVTEDW